MWGFTGNFDFWRIHEKQYIEGEVLKRGRLRQFADLRKGLAKKTGGIFEGVDIQMPIMIIDLSISF